LLSRFTSVAALAVALLATSCSSTTPTEPTPTVVQVTGISPAIGSTQGGTAVTIMGLGFATGATVTIGGVPATGVSVLGATSITAVAPARAAGPANVIVTVSGAQGVLPDGFTYVVPTQGPNLPPTVSAISALGPRPNQPAGMADLGESLSVGVSVTDAETSPSQLIYEWSATHGTFSGSGSTVSWQAPAAPAATPLTVTATLAVVEPFVVFENGQPVSGEHRVERTRAIRVHDSPNEVRGMARQFLLDFSNSSVPVDTVMQNFSTTCGGAAAERADVEKNRCNFTITDYTVGDGTPVINFGGTCVLEDRVHGADACIVIPVRWVSTAKPDAPACPVFEGIPPGAQDVAEGLDQVTALYEGGQWRLCHSDFVSSNPLAYKFKK
jgi:hypothetical protein